MTDLFDIIKTTEDGDGGDLAICLGIRLNIAGHETVHVVTKPCKSLESLNKEAETLKEELDRLSKKADNIFKGSDQLDSLNISSDMGADEIWAILSGLQDEGRFMVVFNGLEEDKRRELAEYVLTKCNIFSGKAATFSSRYDNQTGLME